MALADSMGSEGGGGGGLAWGKDGERDTLRMGTGPCPI